MRRYIGEIEDIQFEPGHPTREDIEMIYVTLEQWQNGGHYQHNPSFWFIYDNSMYYGVSDFDMPFLAQYIDIVLPNGEMFNEYDPGKEEFDYLIGTGIMTYYKFNYERVINDKETLGHYSQYEMNFIKIWNRDSKINKLFEK